jgi:hypothetical protein
MFFLAALGRIGLRRRNVCLRPRQRRNKRRVGAYAAMALLLADPWNVGNTVAIALVALL